MNDASNTRRIEPAAAPGGPAQASRPVPTRQPSRRWRAAVAAVLAVCVLAVVGYWLYGRLTHVRVYDARISADVILISSRVQGWVEDVAVSEGDRIAKGTPLIAPGTRWYTK